MIIFQIVKELIDRAASLKRITVSILNKIGMNINRYSFLNWNL